MANVVTNTHNKRYRSDDVAAESLRDVRQRLFASSRRISGGAVTKVKRRGRAKVSEMRHLVMDAFTSRLLTHWAPIYQNETWLSFVGNRIGKITCNANVGATATNNVGFQLVTDMNASWDTASYNNSVIVLAHGDTTLAGAKLSAFADRGLYMNAVMVHNWAVTHQFTNLMNTKCRVVVWEYRPRFPHAFNPEDLIAADLIMFSYRRGGGNTNLGQTQLNFDYDDVYNMRDSQLKKYWRRVSKYKLDLDAAATAQVVHSLKPGLYSYADLLPTSTALNTNVANSDTATGYGREYMWVFTQVQGAENAFDTRVAGGARCGVIPCSAAVAWQATRSCALRTMPPSRPTENYSIIPTESLGNADIQVFNDETDGFVQPTTVTLNVA